MTAQRTQGTVALRGFTQLQRALRRIEDDSNPELRRRLREVGEHILPIAAANVSHETGRHSGKPTIEAGLRVATNLRGASVYTLAPHGGAQNYGAWTRQGRGPHIKRAGASHYMDRAVTTSQAFVQQEIEAVLDWLTTTFETD